MTIESASHPPDLSTWDGHGESPFYFEVFGETSPTLDTAYAEVVPAGAAADADAAAQSTSSAAVYEYWWTIGHPGQRTEHPLLERLVGGDDLWGRLPDPAAHVYLFFPMGGNWRVKEMAATVKYMSPVPDERTFLTEAAKDWQSIEPFVDGATKLASAAEPVVGSAAAESGKVLSAVAQLKLTSVPAVKGFEWSAAKVAFGNRDHGGVAQGVMWTLPPAMFKQLGGRLTGSLAVSFIPDHKQQPGEVTEQTVAPQPQDLLAHAVVRSADGRDHDHWAPAPEHFVHLRIAPRAPA
jgi:hypothetical protein